jgi:predicted nucleic acid-binding protein
MLRVILDHVALTSALINPHGHAARVLDCARQGRLRLFATQGMLQTEARVLRQPALRQRLGMSEQELADFTADLPALFCLVAEADVPHATRSPEAELLWCAQEGHADVLAVSSPLPAGNDPPEGTQVIRVDQLIELVNHGA